MDKEKQQLMPGDVVTVEEAVEGLLSRCEDTPEHWLEAGVHALLITDPRHPISLGSVMLLSFIDPIGERRQALIDLSKLKKVPEKEITSPERAERKYVKEEGLISLSPLADRTFIGPTLFERGTNEWGKAIGKYQKLSRKKRRA